MACDIRTARVEAGITQQEMADELGISRQTYSNLEKNPERMTVRQSFIVCHMVGKSYEKILFKNLVGYSDIEA